MDIRKNISAREHISDRGCPSQNFPGCESSYSWHKEMSLQPQSQEQNKLENKSTNEGDMEEENGGQKGRREETEEAVNNTLLLLSSRI